MIIPIDEIIFFRGVNQPPTQKLEELLESHAPYGGYPTVFQIEHGIFGCIISYKKHDWLPEKIFNIYWPLSSQRQFSDAKAQPKFNQSNIDSIPMTDPYVWYIWLAIYHQYTPVLCPHQSTIHTDPSWDRPFFCAEQTTKRGIWFSIERPRFHLALRYRYIRKLDGKKWRGIAWHSMA